MSSTKVLTQSFAAKINEEHKNKYKAAVCVILRTRMTLLMKCVVINIGTTEGFDTFLFGGQQHSGCSGRAKRHHFVGSPIKPKTLDGETVSLKHLES